MAWLRDLWQTLSYKLGYAHGLRKKQPYKCPRWADHLVYAQAYMDGVKARPKL
jgi:hypothetical protein